MIGISSGFRRGGIILMGKTVFSMIHIFKKCGVFLNCVFRPTNYLHYLFVLGVVPTVLHLQPISIVFEIFVQMLSTSLILNTI